MADCNFFRARLYELASGELPPQESAALEAHALGCPACAAELESYQEVTRLGGLLPPLGVPPGLLQRFLRAAAGGAEPTEPGG